MRRQGRYLCITPRPLVHVSSRARRTLAETPGNAPGMVAFSTGAAQGMYYSTCMVHQPRHDPDPGPGPGLWKNSQLPQTPPQHRLLGRYRMSTRLLHVSSSLLQARVRVSHRSWLCHLLDKGMFSTGWGYVFNRVGVCFLQGRGVFSTG